MSPLLDKRLDMHLMFGVKNNISIGGTLLRAWCPRVNLAQVMHMVVQTSFTFEPCKQEVLKYLYFVRKCCDASYWDAEAPYTPWSQVIHTAND